MRVTFDPVCGSEPTWEQLGPADSMEGEELPACLWRRRVLAAPLALLWRRHFFTLRRLSGFLSPLLGKGAEPSFLRYFFSTYLALIHASFSGLQGGTPRQEEEGPAGGGAGLTVSWRAAASSGLPPAPNLRRCG